MIVAICHYRSMAARNRSIAYLGIGNEDDVA